MMGMMGGEYWIEQRTAVAVGEGAMKREQLHSNCWGNTKEKLSHIKSLGLLPYCTYTHNPENYDDKGENGVHIIFNTPSEKQNILLLIFMSNYSFINFINYSISTFRSFRAGGSIQMLLCWRKTGRLLSSWLLQDVLQFNGKASQQEWTFALSTRSRRTSFNHPVT